MSPEFIAAEHALFAKQAKEVDVIITTGKQVYLKCNGCARNCWSINFMFSYFSVDSWEKSAYTDFEGAH